MSRHPGLEAIFFFCLGGVFGQLLRVVLLGPSENALPIAGWCLTSMVVVGVWWLFLEWRESPDYIP